MGESTVHRYGFSVTLLFTRRPSSSGYSQVASARPGHGVHHRKRTYKLGEHAFALLFAIWKRVQSALRMMWWEEHVLDIDVNKARLSAVPLNVVRLIKDDLLLARHTPKIQQKKCGIASTRRKEKTYVHGSSHPDRNARVRTVDLARDDGGPMAEG